MNRSILIKISLILVFVASLTASRLLFAMTPSVQLQVDRDSITLDETLRLTIIIQGGSALTTPNIPPKGNFEVVGRNRGNSIEIINSRMSVTNTFVYVLKPRKIGKFSIGPITAHIEGQTYSAGPVRVTVLASGRRQNYQALPPNFSQPGLPGPGVPSGIPAAPPGMPPNNQNPNSNRSATFLTSQTDKNKAYVGEQILYTFRLYSSVSLQNAQLKLPEFKDFISEELIKERKYETNLDGRRYVVNEWRLALFPTKAGALVTGKASVQATIATPLNRTPYGDPFYRGFPARQRLVNKTFSAPSRTLEVKSLPPAPPEFTGLVGEFTINSHLDQDKLNTGETINLKVEIKGKGNVRDARLPKLKDTSFFKVYPGSPQVDIDKSLQGLSGKKVFNEALVAQRPGKTTIGPLETYFFNPKTASFEKLVVPSYEVLIQGSGKQESLVTAGIDRPPSILSNGRGILNWLSVKETGLFFRPIPRKPIRVVLWFILVGSPLVYLVILLFAKKQAKALANVDDRKRSQAFKNAKGALGRLKSMQGDGNINKISFTLKSYLSDAFLVKGAALTPAEIEKLLRTHSVPADSVRRMVYLMEQFDNWKYGGGQEYLPADNQLREEIVDLLREIEKAKAS